jgi:hypothetical protein
MRPVTKKQLHNAIGAFTARLAPLYHRHATHLGFGGSHPTWQHATNSSKSGALVRPQTPGAQQYLSFRLVSPSRLAVST